MKTLITLSVQQRAENNEMYYLATSPDVQGLVVEGETLEETLQIASELAPELLLLQKQRQKKPRLPKVLSLKRFSCPLYVDA